MSKTLLDLNDDVLRYIVEAVVGLENNRLATLRYMRDPLQRWLQRPIDNFSRVSKQLRELCLPFIYAKVYVEDEEDWTDNKLLRAPRVATFMRTLSIDVDYCEVGNESVSPRVATQTILSVIESCSRLRELHLRGSLPRPYDQFNCALRAWTGVIQHLEILHIPSKLWIERPDINFPNVRYLGLVLRYMSDHDHVALPTWASHKAFRHLELFPPKQFWTNKDISTIIKALPEISSLTLQGLLHWDTHLSRCATALARFHKLRHLTVPGMRHRQSRNRTGREIPNPPPSGILESEEDVRDSFFAVCPILETLCIHKVAYDKYHEAAESRQGSLWTKHASESTSDPRSLPANFLAHTSPTDREGRFMVGIPNTFRTNWDDDNSDLIYACEQQDQYDRTPLRREIVPTRSTESRKPA